MPEPSDTIQRVHSGEPMTVPELQYAASVLDHYLGSGRSDILEARLRVARQLEARSPEAAPAPAGPPVQPAKSFHAPWWRQSAVLGGAAAGLVVGVALVLVLALRGGTEDLRVSFTLMDDDSSCAGGTGGYSDVGPGMAVVVRDNEQGVIGTGRLENNGLDLAEIQAGRGCIWSATIEDLPAGEDYYSVSVGDRGEQIYTSEELEEEDWSIGLTLGG